MATAFQSDAFQLNAFQIDEEPEPTPEPVAENRNIPGYIRPPRNLHTGRPPKIKVRIFQ